MPSDCSPDDVQGAVGGDQQPAVCGHIPEHLPGQSVVVVHNTQYTSSCNSTLLFTMQRNAIPQIVIDSVAALARKEALNERDKELFFIHMVCYRMYVLYSV